MLMVQVQEEQYLLGQNEVLQPKLAENQIVGAVQADAIGITSVFFY